MVGGVRVWWVQLTPPLYSPRAYALGCNVGPRCFGSVFRAWVRGPSRVPGSVERGPGCESKARGPGSGVRVLGSGFRGPWSVVRVAGPGFGVCHKGCALKTQSSHLAVVFQMRVCVSWCVERDLIDVFELVRLKRDTLKLGNTIYSKRARYRIQSTSHK